MSPAHFRLTIRVEDTRPASVVLEDVSPNTTVVAIIREVLSRLGRSLDTAGWCLAYRSTTLSPDAAIRSYLLTTDEPVELVLRRTIVLKCPFCHFNNEDGTLFCEQCKSDLAGAVATEPIAAEAVPLEAVPTTAPVALEEAEAVAEPLEATPYEAIPIASETIPLAGEPLPATPVEVEPLAEAPAEPVMEATPVAAPQPSPTPPPLAPPAPAGA
jgi:hypothetical protein